MKQTDDRLSRLRETALERLKTWNERVESAPSAEQAMGLWRSNSVRRRNEQIASMAIATGHLSRHPQ